MKTYNNRELLAQSSSADLQKVAYGTNAIRGHFGSERKFEEEKKRGSMFISSDFSIFFGNSGLSEHLAAKITTKRGDLSLCDFFLAVQKFSTDFTTSR